MWVCEHFSISTRRADLWDDAHHRWWGEMMPTTAGGAIVKTLEVVTETGTVDCWSARMELWGGAEVAWMWCCAAPLVFGLLATLFFLSFLFFLTCRWDGEAARKSPEEEKPGVLEVRQRHESLEHRPTVKDCRSSQGHFHTKELLRWVARIWLYVQWQWSVTPCIGGWHCIMNNVDKKKSMATD